MKILMICNTDGALFMFRKPLITAALAEGYEVIGICGEGEYVNRLCDLGVRVHLVDFTRHSIGVLDNLILFFKLWRIIKLERPDVVHGFTHKPAIFGTIAARISGIRQVLVTITGLGTLFIRNDLRSRLLRWFLLLQYKIAVHPIKWVFFQNPDDLHYFTELGIVKADRALLTNGSGIDLTEYPFPSDEDCLLARVSVELELRKDFGEMKIVLMPGRCVREKGFFEFYEAAQIVNILEPDRYLFIHLGLIDDASSGGIPLENVINFAQRCGVHYLGFKEDINRYMCASDIVVLPSYREGTPRSLIEALALGKCIVTTDVPGCRETVVDEWNGYLCAVASGSSLAKSILRVDTNILDRVRERSRRLCESKYDVNSLIELTLSKYNGT